MKKQILKYFGFVYLLSIAFMFLSRSVLFFTVKKEAIVKEDYSYLLQIIKKGYFFDSLITCYALMLPVFCLLCYSLILGRIPQKLWRKITRIITVIFIILLALLYINIPYFQYNNSPLSVSAFGYFKYFNTTVSMLVSESSYWLFFALFVINAIVVFYAMRKIATLTVLAKSSKQKERLKLALLFLLLSGLCFMGMRGTFKRYPLRVSDASFSNNALYNKITVNPVFYLIKNLQSQSRGFNSIANLIDKKQAYKYVQQELGVENQEGFNLNRNVRVDSVGLGKVNVVVILSESLSIEHFKKKRPDGTLLMPFLDELKNKSYFFTNFYSAGNHTNNGILATLYSVPTIFDRAALQNKDNFFTGLPYYLKNHGYSTHFFITGNPHYDNMNGFLYDCGSIDKIYSLEDYPSEKAVNNFGVADDYLFEYGLDKMKEITNEKKPFFATFLTVSNHPPYVVPAKYKNNELSTHDKIMMFVDDTLKDFFEKALQQKWAKNTIFVVLGDHGSAIGEDKLPMLLSYNHIPMMIYSDLFKNDAKYCSQFGGQIDLAPTIMGMLGLSYENKTLGVDLFREKRKHMFFVSNTHLGCINDSLVYTYDVLNKTDGLFEYRKNNATNKKNKFGQLAEEMKKYGLSMMKVAEEEILSK